MDHYKELPIKDFSYVNDVEEVPKKPSKAKKFYLTIVIILVLALIAALILFVLHNSSKKVVTDSSHKTTSSVSTSPTISAAAGPTTTYQSVDFNLNVTYPKSWSVSTAGTSSMSLISPITQLVDGTLKPVDSKIVVEVQPQGQISSNISSGNSVAVLPSQLVSYTNPTQSQAAQTYVSFIQYPSTTIIGGLDAIYVTGNNGYLKTQTIPAGDVAGLDPLVTITFEKCTTNDCVQTQPVTISSTMWDNSSFKNMILSIIESFSFL
jgi:fumarate reductase subunit D